MFQEKQIELSRPLTLDEWLQTSKYCALFCMMCGCVKIELLRLVFRGVRLISIEMPRPFIRDVWLLSIGYRVLLFLTCGCK